MRHVEKLRDNCLPALSYILASLACLLPVTGQGAERDPLFQSDELLAITLTAPFSTIDRERDKEQEYEGVLTYTDAAGQEYRFDVALEVRGNWRLRKDNCRYSQLWVDFKRGQTEGSIFAEQNRLKLVVQCGNQDRYAEYIGKEQQAYRLFSELSDYYFATRMLNVTYVETGDASDTRTHLAFFIEHQRRLKDRVGMEDVDLNNVPYRELDSMQASLVGVFMYFIGNTDYSMIEAAEGDECCHNAKLLVDASGTYYPIPYDFDASGLVDASYAAPPNPAFRIRNNRDRLFRGFCVPPEVLNGAIARFNSARDRINLIVSDTTYVSERTASRTARFVDDFYEVIEQPRRFEREIIDKCRG